jgi:hypothetical protein
MDLRDNRNVPITPGCTVAYNLSGELAAGRVESVTPSKRYGKTEDYRGEPYVTIKVRLSHRAAGFHPGHLSKVTNPHNVLVLA